MLYERGPDLYAVELRRDGELVERVDEVFFDTLGETLERALEALKRELKKQPRPQGVADSPVSAE